MINFSALRISNNQLQMFSQSDREIVPHRFERCVSETKKSICCELAYIAVEQDATRAWYDTDQHHEYVEIYRSHYLIEQHNRNFIIIFSPLWSPRRRYFTSSNSKFDVAMNKTPTINWKNTVPLITSCDKRNILRREKSQLGLRVTRVNWNLLLPLIMEFNGINQRLLQ